MNIGPFVILLTVNQNAYPKVPANTATAVYDMIIFSVSIIFLILELLWLLKIASRLCTEASAKRTAGESWIVANFWRLDSEQLGLMIGRAARHKNKKRDSPNSGAKATCLALFFVFLSLDSHAESTSSDGVVSSPGMAIMLLLVLVPLIAVIFLTGVKLNQLIKKIRRQHAGAEARELAEELENIDIYDNFYSDLIKRKGALDYTLTNTELGGTFDPDDKKGLMLNISEVHEPRFFSIKRKAARKHDIDPKLIRLIMWYMGSATLWLVIGTTIGEYLGIKLVSPDIDHVSWLSFGRLRPVHTNMVFWGWSSLAMLGLGYYVVPTVSNAPLYSIRKGYQSLILINAAVITGSLMLINGINNGGGEYREYIWPVMLLFALGICNTAFNYLKTVSDRKTKEIYISNWYIIAAVMFITVIALVGYLPWWQDGLGETIVQGYYMHQAVGMWFMLFNLGLIYYFLPQQLNTPIYSYSLGILAFWSQILFYTLIGTHHFIFSSIPWWLQTVAIIGSMGMLIPVFAGTTNFLMTFKGNFNKVARSYTLPFYLVGIMFYFTGSTQGTAEAFRSTNLVWHFTDFTVAHSHLTMYGIIAFMIWASTYTLIPRLTGNEPNQGLVGAHFWLALIGVLFYTIPLMIGGTLKGISWEAGRPFIDGVILMAPYWLWRAIGGSLMWVSHLIFAWNMYTMFAGHSDTDTKNEVIHQLEQIPFKPFNEN